jgi:hypothetical protein
MTRNPERDTERSRVVRARSPSLVVGFENVAVCASHPPIGGTRELGGKIIGSCFPFILQYQSTSFISTDVKDSKTEDSATSIGASNVTLSFEILVRRVTGAVVAGFVRGGIIFDKDHVE